MIEGIVLAAALHMGVAESAAPLPPVQAPVTAQVQVGERDSAYRGTFFRKAQERIRKCIAGREGRFQYFGTGSNGLYQGTYQATDALLDGAAWMFMPELRKQVGAKEAKRIRLELQRTPGHKWHRYWQDRAFYTIFNWEHEGSGAKHWRGGRYAC